MLPNGSICDGEFNAKLVTLLVCYEGTVVEYFPNISKITYQGRDTKEVLAYRFYNPSEKLLGKTMEEHLRLAVCFWHNFCWTGRDVFGAETFERSWLGAPGIETEKKKVDAAFEMITKLGVPFYCFHDVDLTPPTESPKEYVENLKIMTEYLQQKQTESGLKLLWGTANLFSHPRYLHGAATSPEPEVYAWAAHQVFHAMNATKALGGENYVLWGGREGYETLLNTDLKQERQQFGRFLQMVVEHKHAIGFKGTLLIEPKPQEPTKHQYDYDSATVHGFLQEFGLADEVKVNIEVNHATLAGHSIHHEIATAAALGVFGSIDANRGDPQLGWDTDQFPNSVEEMTLCIYEIIKAGGFGSGGFNFDAKLRRASTNDEDLFHGHVGGIDTLALALRKAVAIIEDGVMDKFIADRYKGWKAGLGQDALAPDSSLEKLSKRVLEGNLRPQPGSGQQEYLELLLNRYIYP